MQVDGEPMLVNPCRVRLSLHNTVNMLTKRKTPCKSLNNGFGAKFCKLSRVA